jgi:predicted metal-dependent peptidase
LEKQIDAAIRQASLAGDMLNGMPRGIKEMLVPEVDWKSLLSEFVKTQCTGDDKQTWRRPHKTYLAHDLYLPTPYSDTIGRLLIAGDTSGSIDDDMLALFLGHIQGLCNELDVDGIDIVWYDTNVQGVDRFVRGNMNNLACSVAPKGGGGTDVGSVFDWAGTQEVEYVAVVVFSDGYTPYPDKPYKVPVLWCMTTDETAPWGQVIKIKG